MDLVSARIEILKLVNRHDLPHEVVIGRAKAFEGYVMQPESEKAHETSENAPAQAGATRKSGKKFENSRYLD